jgi:hypothetical protein
VPECRYLGSVIRQVQPINSQPTRQSTECADVRRIRLDEFLGSAASIVVPARNWVGAVLFQGEPVTRKVSVTCETQEHAVKVAYV